MFYAAVTHGTGTGSTPYTLAVADVNADGRPDLLTANYSSNTVGVLLGNGNGTFQAVVTYGTVVTLFDALRPVLTAPPMPRARPCWPCRPGCQRACTC